MAYRSIKTDDEKSHKGHVHFAKEVIDEIKVKCEHEPVAVIVADISGFFDNLDHVLLKKAWLDILNCDKLPPDHNNVFRNTTRFSYIDEVKFFHNFLKKEVLCKKSKYASSEIVRKKVNKMCFFRRNNVVAFCDRDRIPEIRRSGLIETGSFNYLGHHTDTKDGKIVRKGIPQGLPISAVLANIYMMEFDKVVGDWATRNQILYRRYSDDIALVLPSNRVAEAKEFLFSEIKNVKLEIQESKTEVYLFRNQDSGIQCHVVNNNGEEQIAKLNYLGLSFDGKRILLKDKSVAKYYSKMERLLSTSSHYASTIQNNSRGRLFIDRVIRRFTLAGSVIRPRRDANGNKINASQRRYGNYLTYVKRAEKICNSPQIRHQLSRNLYLVNQRLKNAQIYVNVKLKKIDTIPDNTSSPSIAQD